MKERKERRDESERMARLLSEYRLEIIRSKDAEEVRRKAGGSTFVYPYN